MKRFYVRPLLIALCAAGITVLSVESFGSGFQLFEQDGASVGNYHAGYAAEAADASTAFYNPAGITRFQNQQIVIAGVGVATNVKYKGTVAVNTITTLDGQPQVFPVTSQGGVFAFVPAVHYVTPLSERVGFGFSIDVPFGLKVDYGRSTQLRYASTLSSVQVIDISPTLAIKATDKLSFGAGPDIQSMRGEFNQEGTLGGAELDSDGINSADDTGYGYHAGALYEFSPETRAGLSYHSQVVHHLTGTSDFTGPLARDDGLTGPTHSQRALVNITLPPYTALSVFHKINPQFAVMASAVFTQWDTIQNLTLRDVAGVSGTDRIANMTVVIPQYYRNTWNLSVGGDYYATDKIILRSGIGFDQTPVSSTYRNVQMPDNNRYVVAVGGHYQATKSVGMDLGWMHLFINKAHIIPPPQVTGSEIAYTNGSVTAGADVFSAQVTWDII